MLVVADKAQEDVTTQMWVATRAVAQAKRKHVQHGKQDKQTQQLLLLMQLLSTYLVQEVTSSQTYIVILLFQHIGYCYVAL